jgi:hypothetical protein
MELSPLRRNLAVRVRLADEILVLKLADTIISLKGAEREVWYRPEVAAVDDAAEAVSSLLATAGFLVPATNPPPA